MTFNVKVLENRVGYGFKNDLNEPPTLHPHLGGQNMKKREKSAMHVHVIKLRCKFVPINKSQRQSCSSKCLAGYRENIFENYAYLPILQRFQCTPWLCRYVRGAVFPKRRIDLHV